MTSGFRPRRECHATSSSVAARFTRRCDQNAVYFVKSHDKYGIRSGESALLEVIGGGEVAEDAGDVVGGAVEAVQRAAVAVGRIAVEEVVHAGGDREAVIEVRRPQGLDVI